MTIRLITSDELALSLGYSGPNDAFRCWCRKMRITPVPERRGVYDTALVRRRLDEAQGLVFFEDGVAAHSAESYVNQRRARRASR